MIQRRPAQYTHLSRCRHQQDRYTISLNSRARYTRHPIPVYGKFRALFPEKLESSRTPEMCIGEAQERQRQTIPHWFWVRGLLLAIRRRQQATSFWLDRG